LAAVGGATTFVYDDRRRTILSYQILIVMKTNYELRKDVMDEIRWTPQLRAIAAEFGVAANDGVITITGVVDSYWKKVAVEHAAQQVSGVKLVASEVEVKVAASGQRTDAEIAHAIRSALKWNSVLEDEDVDVRVDDGLVYLQGKVDLRSRRDLIQNIVENLKGVTGVCNFIKLNPRPVDAAQIQGKIAAAFRRSATLDSAAVRINAEGSKVSLKGMVRSWAEKKEAESIASAAPGVVTVDNEIEVDTASLN
jgi:osmotically-inducible protein OsmY